MLSATTIQAHFTTQGLSPVSKSILKVLLYFRIFNYPIRKEELFNYLNCNNKIETQATLARLIGEGMVKCEDDFV